MSRGAEQSGRAACKLSGISSSTATVDARPLTASLRKRARIWGTRTRGREWCPKNQIAPPFRRTGATQVAVLAGVLGAAACAFSWARFSSHSAFFLARRSRLRRAVRGSCGLPIVGGCLAEVFGCVALISHRLQRARAGARARARKSARLAPGRPALAHAGGWEAAQNLQSRERRGEIGHDHGHVYVHVTGRAEGAVTWSERRAFLARWPSAGRRPRLVFRPFRAVSRRSF